MVVMQHAHDVRAGEDDPQLERQLCGIDVHGELTPVGGRLCLSVEQVAPLPLHSRHFVVDGTRSPAGLGRRRHEEAAAREHAPFDIGEISLAQRNETIASGLAGCEGAGDLFLGPPGTGKTHLAIGISIRACQAGHRVQFATAAEWVDRLTTARVAGRLHHELRRLGRLFVIDEVGYIPLEADAANLFFQLISSRYERASLLSVIIEQSLGRWSVLADTATVTGRGTLDVDSSARNGDFHWPPAALHRRGTVAAGLDDVAAHRGVTPETLALFPDDLDETEVARRT
jgi:hypothetical protein